MGQSPKAPSEPQVGASEAGSNPLKPPPMLNEIVMRLNI